MKTCAICGEKIEGRASKLYCGKTCKQAAYMRRKIVDERIETNRISTAQKKDLKYIREKSPDAYDRLIKLFALCGKQAFDMALDAVFSAVVDVVEAGI